ncbi:hypothetical protein [Nonomuraea roseola]|uniref:Uncharacterized protein n=1 Tax=Nonomuraea roseola TaxID=46179 RepID=A0ABV5PTD2_9ACTN
MTDAAASRKHHRGDIAEPPGDRSPRRDEYRARPCAGERVYPWRADADLTAFSRHAGMPWAPPSALFELEDGNGRKRYVMAMPYFVNDGSAPDPEAMALMRMQTNNQLDDTNYRVIGGKPVVIDAGDIEKDDLDFCQRPPAFDRYGRFTATCRAPAVVFRPNHLVRLLCAACASTCT